MSEEENKVLEYFKNKQVYDMELVFNYIPILLNIIEGLSTKVDTGIEIIKELKEIEKSHQEENGKLRVELEQEKNKINTIKQLMSIGDVTDEALFTLVQTIMAELDRLEDIEEQLDKENEKNKSLKKQIKEMQEYYKNADFIFKDKIKEKMKEILGYTYSTAEERQQQNYAYDRLKELLEEE